MKALIATAMFAVTLGLVAPLSFAQSAAPPMATTSTTTTTTSTTAPAPEAAPPPAVTTTTTVHTQSSTTTTDTGLSTASSSGHSCRTRHAAGESCSCVSAPTSMGTSQDQNGHHVCVVP